MSKEINRKISEAKLTFVIDWTGDETANAELLEEMPCPTLYKALNHSDGNWICHPPGRAGEAYPEGEHADRKTAIALAWLKWKGLL